MSVRLPGEAVAKALDGLRACGTDRYDERAFHYLQATGVHEAVPFMTLTGHAVARAKAANLRLPREVERRLRQEFDLVHRPIALPGGSHQVTVLEGLMWTRVGNGPQWVVPTGAATPMFDQVARKQDVHGLLHLQEGLWLPFPELVDAGRFPRMQEIRERLRFGAGPGELRVFVSHRWQSPRHPDPGGEQARTVAWRLFGAVCEAVRVAHRRGLHEPRQLAGGLPIGPAGSALTESVVVNVLRERLDDDSLAEAAAEVALITGHVGDLGAAQGRSDAGLAELRAVVGTVPVLRGLLRHIHLWYDYSCMPQAPRTQEETELFRRELERLVVLQAASRTLVLLDEVHDYLGRAWCHLEASTAERITGLDVVWFDENPRPGRQSEPYELVRLVKARQQITWRALLDTDVLGLQSPPDCLRRLGLSAAEAEDLPHIYRAMRAKGAPAEHGFGPGSLVTGVVPLPVVEDGQSVLALLDTVEHLDHEPRFTGSIDLMDCLRINGRADAPAFQRLASGAGCHVAVVATCEAEAMMISARLRERLPELEKLLLTPVTSMSWLAIDQIPVGHRPHGTLRAQPITARVWALVGAMPPTLTNFYVQLLSDADIPAVSIDLSSPFENVHVLPEGLEWQSYLVRNDFEPATHPQGLLHHHLYRHLLQPNVPVHER